MRKTSRAMRARLDGPAGYQEAGDDWEAAALAHYGLGTPVSPGDVVFACHFGAPSIAINRRPR